MLRHALAQLREGGVEGVPRSVDDLMANTRRRRTTTTTTATAMTTANAEPERKVP